MAECLGHRTWNLEILISKSCFSSPEIIKISTFSSSKYGWLTHWKIIMVITVIYLLLCYLFFCYDLFKDQKYLKYPYRVQKTIKVCDSKSYIICWPTEVIFKLNHLIVYTKYLNDWQLIIFVIISLTSLVSTWKFKRIFPQKWGLSV